MKHFSLFILFLFSLTVLQAQYDFSVIEKSFKFSTGTHNAVSIHLYELEKEDAEKLTKKWLKAFKGKVKQDGHEYTAMGSTYKDMTDLDFNMTALLLPNGENFTLSVCIDLGGAFMNSSDHKKQFEVFKAALIRFAKNATKEGINIQLKNANEELKKNEKNQEELEKQKKNLEEEIQKAQSTIKKAEGEIKKNEEAQGNQKEKIEASKNKVKSIKSKLGNI